MSIIDIVQQADVSYCKFLSANDTGETGGHQCGIYIPNEIASILSGVSTQRGRNDERSMPIQWDDRTTPSVMHYYGEKTRNESRLTRFGQSFPYLDTGNLFIIARIKDEFYATTLNREEDIETFLAEFNLSPLETNQLIKKERRQTLEDCILKAIDPLSDFPSSIKMSTMAQDLSIQINQVSEEAVLNTPDEALLQWVSIEYDLFRELEKKVYTPKLSSGFPSIKDFISFANQVLNRRKSRAGHSLEHHLARIFSANQIQFEEQVITEGKKRPDFIFPSGEAYHSQSYPKEKLIFLGAKTTCKDRWRQVVTEATNIRTKFLFTLQQGISSNQLDEMTNAGVRLVVPQNYIVTYPQPFRSSILSLKQFIDYTREVLL